MVAPSPATVRTKERRFPDKGDEYMLVQNPIPVTEGILRNMARQARDEIDHIYLHWTAGHYGQVYDDYHLCIDRDGTVYVNCKQLDEYKAHTYGRNTGAIGIALCCGAEGRCWLPKGCAGYEATEAWENMFYATPNSAVVNFGTAPPTADQIEVMADIVSILCEELELPITEETVMTHCEAAFEDCYGPGDGDPDFRWDLWFLPDRDRLNELVPGGELLRGKALFYQYLREKGFVEPRYEPEAVLAVK
ncbi:MAG: N-acetylmuramoyl-L-alanine amidase [Acidaminococcaceae bacterium]|nr:N-acetylmuramoyl-L-alanine amidase [Acidaminococcaceae bacterium]